MIRLIAYLKDETGAVTVDWVVLTSGVVVLGFVLITPVRTAVYDIGKDIGDKIAAFDPFPN